jgi:hypothetical protein
MAPTGWASAPAGERRLVKSEPAGFAVARENVAPLERNPLHHVDEAQLEKRIDADVTVAADPQIPARGQVIDRPKDAVAEIGLRGRAEADDRARRGEAPRLSGSHVRRMHDAPLRVDPGVLQQPFDRARAAPGDAIVDFLVLFRGVDMDWCADELGARERDDLGELMRRDRSEAVRRHADDLTFLPRQLSDQPQKAAGVVDKAPLCRERRCAAEIRVRIKDRQQRQANARRGRCSANPLGHLPRVGVGSSGGIVIQIVKFADARIAGFQQFDVELRRDGLLFVGPDPLEEAIHFRAPRPEVVRGGSSAFGESRKRPLKGMRMDVWHAGDERPLYALGVRRRGERDSDGAN